MSNFCYSIEDRTVSTRDPQPPLVLLVLPHCQEAQAANSGGLLDCSASIHCDLPIFASYSMHQGSLPAQRLLEGWACRAVNFSGLSGSMWQPLCFVACLLRLLHTGMRIGAVMLTSFFALMYAI